MSHHLTMVPCYLLVILLVVSPIVCQLDNGFYEKTCPKLCNIVRRGVYMAIQNDTRMAASLLRLHFHDCIVNGCDASVLLEDTSNFTGEMNAPPNHNSIRGFQVIDRIKEQVEEACPSTVSCADILTLAAREAVSLSGGPYWSVPMGRRDSLTASQQDANEQIPSPFEPLYNITAKFTSKGLHLNDLVVLSGGHTIGFAQCFTFKDRLFNFNESGKPDPSLDSALLTTLQSTCPNDNGSNTNSNLAPLDIKTAYTFDNLYFKNLINNSGLLQSDQALLFDPSTSALVDSYGTNYFLFARDFATSMIKLGNVGVLTGQNGQIRQKCGFVNSNYA